MLRRHWPAAILFLAAVLTLTNPLVLHLWNAVEDKQDALLNTWIMAWVGHAALSNPLGLYNTNIFYPYLNTLAFSDLLIPQGLLAIPLSLSSGNPIFGYNLALLAMLWLDAFGMYLLVLDWTGSRAAGCVAGMIFGLNPFNLGNLAQIQLLSLGFLPLALMYLRRMLIASNRRELRLSLLLFVLFFVLETLSSLYYALLAGFAAALLAIWLFVSRQRGLGVDRRNQVVRLFLAGALFALVLAPFLLPYIAVQRELGLQRKLQESEPFSASLLQYAQVEPESLLYGRMLAPNPVRYEGGYPLDDLFPGLLAIALAAVGVIDARVRIKWYWIALASLAFVLSLGPRLYLAPGQGTGIVLPYTWLYDLFPPMRALRAPVRFDALVMLAIAGLAGPGLIAITARFHALRTRLPTFAPGLAAAALVALEYTAIPAANIRPVAVGAEVPPVYRWLSEQPRGVTVELPLMGKDENNRLDLTAQYFSIYHWNATPDGYSGFVPAGRGSIGYELSGFPSPRAISVLRSLGTKYLVIHFDKLKSIGITPTALARTEDLSLLREFGETQVYSVAPAPENAAVFDRDWYIPQPVAAGAPFTAYVILSNRSNRPYATLPTDKITWTARWSNGRVETGTTGAPLVTSSISVVPLRLTAPSRTKQDTLHVDLAGPFGSFTLTSTITVGKDSAQEIVIPARVRLAEELPSVFSPGAAITVHLEWDPLNKIDAYYSVSVRVADENGNKIVNVDREPAGQTLLWRPEQPVDDTFTLTLPPGLTAGHYRIELLMYDGNSDAGVLLLDMQNKPQENIVLAEFEVK